MKKTRLIVAVAAAIGMVGSVAYAAIPNGTTIHGCYKKANGQLRVTEVSEDCGPSELAISWNQQGPKGDKGVKGDRGLQGLQGQSGADGADGRDGVDGTDGVDGRDGVDGEDGLDGQPGPPGPPGPPGISGARFTGTLATGSSDLPDSGDFVKVHRTTVPAGNYAVTATVDAVDMVNDENTVICELRKGAGWIGGNKTALPEGYSDAHQTPLDYASLTITGGAAVGSGGGEISLWCRSEGHDSVPAVSAELMILQVGGFF